jgi:hypothetical protein
MNADPVDPDAQRGYERASCGFTKDDLESLGEREVRARFTNGGYGHPNTPPFVFVSAWLEGKDFGRREAESISIRDSAASSRSAADSARLAARWAMWAAIIATIDIVTDSKDQIVAFVISWLP